MSLSIKDIEEIEKIPLEERVTERTTHDIISKAAKKYSNKTALIFLPPSDPLRKPLTFTYQELLNNIHQIANGLIELGVVKSDAVSYILPNISENYFLLWGAQIVGIANPISPVLPPEQIADVLKQAGSKILVTIDSKVNLELWENIQKVRKLSPQLEKIIVIGGETDISEKIYDFNALFKKQSIHLKKPLDLHPDSICSYFHTSGTTGTPKLAKHTHWGNVHQAWVFSIFAKYNSDTIALSGLPMFHVGAPVAAGLSVFMQGGTAVVMSPFGWMDPLVISYFWKIVEKYKGTSTVSMPVFLNALIHVPVAESNITSLKTVISGNAVTEHDFNTFKKITDVGINNLWGQTEVTCMGTFNASVVPGDAHFGAMGVRCPYQLMKVVKLDSNGYYMRDCGPSEPGVLCVKGPNVVGYKDPQLNKTCFISGDWLNAGDWVSQDKEGYFWILGRAQDFILRGNITVSLLEIENAFSRHIMVKKVAAIGVPDPEKKGSELPVVYIELQPKANVTPEELKKFIQKALKEKPESIPAEIFFHTEMPVNGMGKVLKYKLKEEFLKNILLSQSQCCCGRGCKSY